MRRMSQNDQCAVTYVGVAPTKPPPQGVTGIFISAGVLGEACPRGLPLLWIPSPLSPLSSKSGNKQGFGDLLRQQRQFLLRLRRT